MRVRTVVGWMTIALLLPGGLGCVRRQLPAPVESSPPSRGKVAYQFIANPSIGKPQNTHAAAESSSPIRNLSLAATLTARLS